MVLAKMFPLVAVVGALLSACTTTDSSPRASLAPLTAPIAAMNTGIDVQAPHGFAAMCLRAPDLCDLAGGVTPVAYAPLQDPQMALLDTVNRSVNAKVRQQSDWTTHNTAEVWSRPVVNGGLLSGDCEDLAIEKRLQLIQAGVDPRSLFYAVVYRRDIGLHVLLIVSTSQGDLALDSRSPWIQPWNKVPYTWVKRQLPENPSQWAIVITPTSHNSPLHLASASNTFPAP